MSSYTLFNLYEAIFWIIVGITSYVIGRYLPQKYRGISIYSSLIFILFGLSDFIEIKTQGFLYPIVWWLLLWKIICVLAMVHIIIWYLKLRLKSN